MDLILEFDSGHIGTCKIYLDDLVLHDIILDDTDNDSYIGHVELDPGLYLVKYYIDGALVDFYNQLVASGLVIANSPDTYVSVASADEYFSQRLRTSEWTLSSDEDKLKALIQATEIIDGLSYTVAPASSEHAFPQVGSTEVPLNILRACCEIANSLIKGIDPDMEVLSSNILETKIDGGSVKMNGKTFAHFQNGVPSVLAWRYLLPYLRSGANIKLERIDL